MTYDEMVQLQLNLERIRWRKIDDMVQAFKIANGAVPPPAYFKALGEDDDQAMRSMGDMLLTKMVQGTRRGR